MGTRTSRAHVDFQVHDDWGVYRTTRTYNPPTEKTT